MTSKIDTLKDKIFDLEIELKELQDLTKLAYPNGYVIPEELQQSLQETICYIQYFQQELKHLEDMKYE